MVVLSAIGRFFKKIWDWIKQTAWIQPLLIVGIIFGVIFSIPSIVNGIKEANQKKHAAEVFYFQYQLSLEGDANSAADKLTKAIEANDATKLGFGEDKFFLVYVSESCSECANVKGAFQVLEENLGNDTFKSDDGNSFKLVTIFTDQETTSTTERETAFEKYMDRNQSFFSIAGGNAQNSDYYEAGHLNADDVEHLTNASYENFLAPTIMLVDLSPSDDYLGRGYQPGVQEILFGVSGENDFEKAKTLLDCWNHAGDFNIND